MNHTPGLWHVVLVSALVVILLVKLFSGPLPIWDRRIGLPRRVRQSYNPRRNRERWARRRQVWERRHGRELQRERRQRRRRIVQRLLASPPAIKASTPQTWRPPRASAPAPAPTPVLAPPPPDPLADLRASRGWVDQMDERQLWGMLVRVCWPHGAQCPHCGETDPRYLKRFDPEYRGGLGRWQCQVCAWAGDPGQAGTFTPLTGTVLDGLRVDVRTLWLIIEALANGQASLETAKEARVNRHTTDRLFRLLRAALYHARSTEPIVLTPDQVAEADEVYITAGLKGHAGGLKLERDPRWRGLKRRGRGDWDIIFHAL